MLEGKRVCVVGSGISGLSSAWLLHRNGAAVTLLEKDETCGGHTLTDRTSAYPVDLGFQVYNLTTYPHLVGFLDALGVDTQPSDMSFALSMDNGKLEWGSDNLDTIFAQRSNLTSPMFLTMIKDVVRFGKEAPKVLEQANYHIYRDMSLGDFLAKHGYSEGFLSNYVVPMCAAVWSVPSSQVLKFPVQMLVRFWVNHHLLDLFQRPLWRVVKGRSQTYVKRVCDELPDVRTSTPVLSARRADDGVHITTPAGMERFDAVVFATHSDVTLRILGDDADPSELAVLKGVPYNDNQIYLHTDPSLMPRNRKVWSSWNFLGSSSPDTVDQAVCVSYWANRLQEFPPGTPDMFVTLNPPRPPAKDKIIRELVLAHPVFGAASVEAQARLPSIQGNRNTYFAGAWTAYGFHEDGIRSAVAVVEAMGGKLPWAPRATSPKRSLLDQCYLAAFDRFMRAGFTVGKLRLILPSGHELHYGSEDMVTAPVPKGDEWRGLPERRCTVRVLDNNFFRRVMHRHDVGLGEAYMAADFEADSLPGLMATIVANARQADESRNGFGPLAWVSDKLMYLAHRARPNTIEGSRKNIAEHYDAGNAMYKLFLDHETLTYSSGVYRSPTDSLTQAQYNKIDALVAKAGIKAGDHVLEIGCGWGGFAIRAVRATGCTWTGITLSKEQLSEATERVAAAGLSDKITFLYCDYRDVPGVDVYDKVVSVEMIEAVGHEHLRPYFGVIGRVLKPGGRAVLQAICSAEERYEVYCNTSDFIREHIFPGGHLPSLGAIADACRGTGLTVHDTHDIGPDYAITLRQWRAAWEAKREQVLSLGYSDVFWRKYRFYFVYCEAAFDARYIHNYHLLFVKDQEPVTPTVQAGADSAFGAGALAAGHGLGGALSHHMAHELPSDPMTQVLLSLYFFLTGMLVRSHPHMWLVPATTCAMAALGVLVHSASMSGLGFYKHLTPSRRAWWCADITHLLYSLAVSLWAINYVVREPAALRLAHPPSSASEPSLVTAASAGVFAFQLWVCMRGRLWQRTLLAIVQYTTLLVVFGTATFKGVAVPFLAVTLVSELFSVAFLAGKLLDLAGLGATGLRRATRRAEQATLVLFRVVPHALMSLVVLASPGAFSSLLYYFMCLLAMALTNYVTYHKLDLLLLKPAQAGKVHTA